MTRDFLAELKDRIRRVDSPPPAPSTPPAREMPAKRYNIHKRSLPPGIDKIVVFNLSRREANWWAEHVLKTRCYENGPDDSKTIIYYDVIPVDAKPRERSIYFNPGPTTIE